MPAATWSDMPGTASGGASDAQKRELLEWVVVRLSVIIDRCEDPEAREELMWLVEELTSLIEGS
jgi:hypothetical protein